MHAQISVGSFIKFGWETFKKRPWLMVGVVLLLTFAQLCVSLIVGILDGVGGSANIQAGTGLISFIINMMGQAIVTMGTLTFFIKAHDDIEAVRVSHAWHLKNFWNFLGLFVLLNVILIIGFMLLIVPGIIAFLMFMFAPYLVVDRGLGPIEALKESARITSGHKWRLFVLAGAIALIVLLGLLALLIGLLVAIPVAYLTYMHAYRTISRAASQGIAPHPLAGGEKILAGLFVALPVLVFVGLFATILGTAGASPQNSSAVQVEANLLTLGVAVETYYDENNSTYPVDLIDAITLMPEGSDIDVSRFSYTIDADRSSYSLCAIDPVPAGSERCLSSEAATPNI